MKTDAPTRRIASAILLPLLLAFLLGCVSGCYTPYSKQALPKRLFDEHEARSLGFRIGDRVSLYEEGFRFFSWPITEPSAIDVANRIIDQYQAVGIANMEVDYTEWAILFLWSYPAVTVTADLVLGDEGPDGRALPAPTAAPALDPGR